MFSSQHKLSCTWNLYLRKVIQHIQHTLLKFPSEVCIQLSIKFSSQPLGLRKRWWVLQGVKWIYLLSSSKELMNLQSALIEGGTINIVSRDKDGIKFELALEHAGSLSGRSLMRMELEVVWARFFSWWLDRAKETREPKNVYLANPVKVFQCIAEGHFIIPKEGPFSNSWLRQLLYPFSPPHPLRSSDPVPARPS